MYSCGFVNRLLNKEIVWVIFLYIGKHMMKYTLYVVESQFKFVQGLSKWYYLKTQDCTRNRSRKQDFDTSLYLLIYREQGFETRTGPYGPIRKTLNHLDLRSIQGEEPFHAKKSMESWSNRPVL